MGTSHGLFFPQVAGPTTTSFLADPGWPLQVGVLFGNPETTSGGNALKFYASMRLDIRARDKITETGRVEPVGNRVKVKVVKNKVRVQR
jgi:hypothetical protein